MSASQRFPLWIAAALLATACRPSDILSVPPPIGVLTGATNSTGAEAELAGATAQLAGEIVGFLGVDEAGGLMSDENVYAEFFEVPQMSFVASDARITNLATQSSTSTSSISAVGPVSSLLGAMLTARSSLFDALAALKQYESGTGRSKIGEAYALAAYAEMYLAETFCAGVPLSATVPGGGVQYGVPLTSDSLLGTAEAHFDSALAYAGTNDTVVSLAAVGLGRTRLDRANFAGAATAVANVPIGFVYGAWGAATVGGSLGIVVNMYAQVTGEGNCSSFNVGNQEGGTGLNFVTAGDARLQFITTAGSTCDGGTWYYPIKFGNPSRFMPFATGVEAELIAAEAALHAGNAGTWASDLNALRTELPQTYLAADSSMHTLSPDSTTGASADEQVDVLFRERAFWLYGMGSRLSDLRRLVRQYGRAQNTVFPTGTYVNGESPELALPIPNYGTDVSFMIPTQNSGWTSNPYYKGCLSPPSTP